MSACYPGCEGESRQEIKQLHPSYLLNSSSLEDTCAGGQPCTWILKLWKGMFFSFHIALCLLSTLQPHLPCFCFWNTLTLFLPPDFAYCCSLGLSPRSPALHATGPTILQVTAQLTSWQRLSLIFPCKKSLPGFSLALCPVISFLYLIQHLCLFSVFACLLYPYHISSWGRLGWWTALVLELDCLHQMPTLSFTKHVTLIKLPKYYALDSWPIKWNL